MPEETSLRSNAEMHLAAAPAPLRWPVLVGAGGLVLLVFAVFWPVFVLDFKFVQFDVPDHVINNPDIRGLTGENLKRIFTSRGTTSSYYPVRTLSFAVDYQLWGLNPRGFKLTNVLVHSASVLLVFWLILRLFGHPAGVAGASCPCSAATGETPVPPIADIGETPVPPIADTGETPVPPPALARRQCHPRWDVSLATFAAAIFAVHPLVVEPVAWVAGREELLMTLGALGTIHFYLTARRLESLGGNTLAVLACFAGATLCCVFACLSNAVGAVIPFLITAWDILTLARPRLWRILYGTTGLWLMGIATVVIKQIGARKDLARRVMDIKQAGVMSAVIQKLGYGSDVIVGETGGVTGERLMLILNVFFLNLKSLLWPTKLAVHHQPVTARSFLEADVLLGALAIGLIGLALLWLANPCARAPHTELLRRRKLVVFGLAWFFLALAPTAQIMPHHIHRADRFLYLPLVGLALAIALGFRPLGRLVKRPAAAAGALALGVSVVLLLDCFSAGQVQTWRNTITMWENCVEVDPNNLLAHITLAERLEEAEQYQRAYVHYEKALQINAFNVAALNEFALYLATCDDKRLRNYELAVKLAEWACQLSQWNIPEVVHSLALVYNNLAVDQGDRGEFRQAIDNYDKACRTDPQYAAPRFNLALLLATCRDERFRRTAEAVRLAEQACQMANPLEANHLMILAVTYAQAGQSQEAIDATQRAIRLADAEGNDQLAKLLRGRLELYRQQNPPRPGGD